MIGKILGVLLIFTLLISYLGDIGVFLILVLVCIVVLIVIIRLIADLYWWGKDKNDW